MTPPAIDYSQYRFYFDVAQFILTGAIGVYFWISNRGRINRKRFVDLEKDVSKKISATDFQEMLDRQLPDCNKRLEQIKALEQNSIRFGAEMQSMPSREEIRSFTDGVSRLSAKIAKLDGKFEGVNRAVDLINDHLINKGSNK